MTEHPDTRSDSPDPSTGTEAGQDPDAGPTAAGRHVEQDREGRDQAEGDRDQESPGA